MGTMDESGIAYIKPGGITVINDLTRISCRIGEIRYNWGDGRDAPMIHLQLDDLQFSNKTESAIPSQKCLWLYLTRSAFTAITGQRWDGSPQDIERLQHILVGKKVSFDIKLTICPEFLLD